MATVPARRLHRVVKIAVVTVLAFFGWDFWMGMETERDRQRRAARIDRKTAKLRARAAR
jgi:hypothetical protein